MLAAPSRWQTPTSVHRGDLAIHALAQLPDRVTLQAEVPSSEARSIALLARAYGIDERIEIASVATSRVGRAGSAGRGQVIYTSPGAGSPTPFVPGASSLTELIEGLYHADDEPAALRDGDDALTGQRVVIVVNRPTHYRVALFNRLAERLATFGSTLCVLFTTDLRARPWMRPEPMAFEHVGVGSSIAPTGMPEVCVDLERRLRQMRPTLLLAGSLSPAIGGRVAHFAQRHHIAFGVWTGEIDTSPTSGGRLRRLQRQWILRRCHFAVAYGYRAREYLRAVAPALPVVYGRNTSPFEPPPNRSSRDAPVEILAVSQAIPRKRLDLAIDAVCGLDDGACRLTIIGSGPCLETLRARAHGHDNVSVLGLVGSDRVLEAYRDADIFLFPSGYDLFGLVLVEAMGCGLATVVSVHPGAVADLAVSGRNCIVVEEPSPESWTAAVGELVRRPTLRTSVGAAGHATIRRRWTVDHGADAVAAGLRLGVLASAGGHRAHR